jgi:hypothetical protein
LEEGGAKRVGKTMVDGLVGRGAGETPLGDDCPCLGETPRMPRF